MCGVRDHSYVYVITRGLGNYRQVAYTVLIYFNVGFTEVVQTVGGQSEEGADIYNRYTVTTRMISALRWAAM